MVRKGIVPAHRIGKLWKFRFMTLLQEYVRKVGLQWFVVSHQTGKKIGYYGKHAGNKR